MFAESPPPIVRSAKLVRSTKNTLARTIIKNKQKKSNPNQKIGLSVLRDTNPNRTLRREKIKQKNLEKENWYKMSPAEKEAKAMQEIERTWLAASKYYGKEGTPMPDTRFGDTEEAGGRAYNQTANDPHVVLPPGIISLLAKPKTLQYEPKVKANARTTLLHEWAHYFQSPELFEDPNANHAEEAAQLFATYFSHKLFGAKGMAKKGVLPYGNRRQSSKDLAEAYGPSYWLFRQFE